MNEPAATRTRAGECGRMPGSSSSERSVRCPIGKLGRGTPEGKAPQIIAMRLATVPSFDSSPMAPAPPWPPVLATRGLGGKSELHAHHAMHLLLARTRTLSVRTASGGAEQPCAGIVTAPDAAHAVDAIGNDVLLVFVDPESEAGRALHAVIEGSVRFLTPRERDALADDNPAQIMGRGGLDWTDRARAVLGAQNSAHRPMHPRVRRLLRTLPSLPIRGATPVQVLAQVTGLSSDRFMHVFEESIGIPVRPYLLWWKLQRAAAAIAKGEPLTRAALHAGFSDAAHMTRTFQRMLGVPPSALRVGGG